VVFNGVTVADSTQTYRVLETSHPPVYYIPPGDVQSAYLSPVARSTFCEWKGAAQYFDLTVGDRCEASAVWCYPTPTERFAAIAHYLAFYPSRMDVCYVNDEAVQPQVGDFYGGWITKSIVGPFKGGRGTWGW
jgi:uncharacterized protein (DUF427 family)